MGFAKVKGKNRLDKYYRLAKEQGYRSRAAFKLTQLNRKFNFLQNCRALVDLCAAPGGWLQVAAKTLPMASLVIGVDLVPIKPIRGVKTLVADITTAQCRQMLKKELNGNMADVVLHDGAPNVGGNWNNEAYTQSALVLDSLKLATEFLAPKGTFVTKIFRSKDYNALLYVLNQLFARVESTKPAASRNASAEIFVVCQGYKAPAKIDPRLLDPKHLFQEVAEPKKVLGPDALIRAKIKQTRHREGYDDGVSITRKVTSAAAFVASDSPVEMLGSFTAFALDGPDSWAPVEGVPDVKEVAASIRTSAATNAEIRALCGDLQVLGRTEFKALLKWRLALRKAVKDVLAAVAAGDAAGGGAKGAKKDAAPAEAQDPEEAMLAEMAAIKDAAERRAVKDKKKRRELKKKSKIRAAQLAQSEGITDDAARGVDGESLFTLAALKGGGAGGLDRVVDMAAPADDDLEVLELPSDDEDGDGGAAAASGSDSDEDEALRYEAELEEALEDSYASYLKRQGVREAMLAEKRRRLGMEGEMDEDGGGGDGDDDNEQGGDAALGGVDGEEDEDGHPLLVTLDEDRAGVAKSRSAMAAQWFKQDLFADPDLVAGDDDDDDGVDEDDGDGGAGGDDGDRAAAAGPGSKRRRLADDQDGGCTTSDEDDDDDQDGKAKMKKKKTQKSKRSAGLGGGGDDDGGDFEVVAQESSDDDNGSDKDGSSSESSEDEFDMLDDQGKAEVLALAKRMLRRKEKLNIIDAAYNRYAFHDAHLPRWFMEDERRHMRPVPQVTKEEIEAEKARLRAVDARPIKKIVEAKARKQRRFVAQMQKARQAANAIADQEDMPAKARVREIEKLYSKARTSVFGKKGGKGGRGGRGGKGGGGGGRKGPPLDKRMKKDARGMKRAAARGGKKGGRGGSKAGGRR